MIDEKYIKNLTTLDEVLDAEHKIFHSNTSALIKRPLFQACDVRREELKRREQRLWRMARSSFPSILGGNVYFNMNNKISLQTH